MKRQDIKHLLISLATHICLIATFLLSSHDQPILKNSSNLEVTSVDLVDKQDMKGMMKGLDVKVKEMPALVKDKDKKRKNKVGLEKQSSKGVQCDQWYGGIGIEVTLDPKDTSMMIIGRVFEGYPARAAGLKAGDEIVYVDGKDIKGEIGTVVNIKVIRDNRVLSFTITRAKICY